MLSIEDVALFRHFPTLQRQLTWVRLGHWPTPVQELVALPGATVPVHVKREDLSSPRYGGNKVRTLEAAMGLALEDGADCIFATGAYGSNHATATVMHAPSAGLQAGAALFPQPVTSTARANISAMLAQRPLTCPVRHAVELPLAMARLRRRHPRAYVMPPGAATPRGALGALSAALELAEQVAEGACPAPAEIVLAIGSTCTTAGLLAGLQLARALGIAFVQPTPLPRIYGVRVTPWPITSPLRIVRLALQTSRYLAEMTGAPMATWRQLSATLTVDGRYLGAGYGQPTVDGLRAQRAFAQAGGPPLDFVYSAKSAAALLRRSRRNNFGPVLFWATKSSAPLPSARPDDLQRAPRAWRQWLQS